MRMLLATTCLVCLVVLVFFRVGWSDRQSETFAARRALDTVAADAQSIVRLRSLHATVAYGKRPEADVISRINAALSAEGIPTRVLSNVSQASDTALPGDQVSRRSQSIRFTLGPISVSQLGEFLDAWRMAKSTWSVTQIELSTNARTEDETAAYIATLTIGTIYVVEDEES